MKTFLTALLLSAISLFGTTDAMAAAAASSPPAKTIDVSGLSPEQIAVIQSVVSQTAPAAPAEPKPTEFAQNLDKAAEIARVLGTGLATTARELGMAVNDFASTGTGKMVTAVLLWKYMGRDVLGILVGTLVLIAGFALGLRMVRRGGYDTTEREYTVVPVFFGLYKRSKLVKETISRPEKLTDSQQVMQLAGYVIIVASFIVGMCTIF